MATDTTELTFIRCPDCRSLVPAMSSRCRMCGASLAKDAQPEGTASSTNTPPAQSRVRQQTVATSSSSELSQQLSALRNDSSESPSPVKSIPEKTPVEDSEEFDEFSDPLEDFLSDDSGDDSEDENNAPLEASSEVAEDSSELDEFDEFDDLEDFDDLDDLDDLDEEEPQPAPVQAISVPEPKEEQKAKVDSATINKAKDKVDEELKPKTRVVVEQGRGKFSKGLSFGASKPRFDAPSTKITTETPKEVATIETAAIPEEKVVEVKAVEEKVVNEKVVEEKNTTSVITEKVLKQEPDMQPKLKVDHSEEVVEETKKHAKLSAAPVNSSVGTKDSVKKGEQLGRIFGWLVSYTDPMGRSIELREGRFFVSSAQLRTTDLVLEDETVSTPHAMFTISTDGGIVIQDLKSERGVFVREPSQSTYRREYDSISLSHGDWVRFGDLEFLVSIIAHVGAN